MIPLLLSVAMAQDIDVPDMNVQYFRPSIDAKGTLWVDDVQGGHDGFVTPRVLLHYADLPATYRFDSSAEVPVVNGVAMGEVLLGWRTGPVRLGLDVPVILSAEGLAASGEFALGDISVDAQVGTGDEGKLGVGGVVRYAAPTSTAANPLGSPSGDLEALALATLPFSERLALVANAGVGTHPGVDVEGLSNVQVRGRAALRASLTDDAGVASEWVARLPVAPSEVSTQPTAVETLASAWVRGGAATVRGGLGTSVSGGLGASQLRAVIGVEWGPQPLPPDADGDGIIDAEDACRLEAEDVDGVLGGDGCPDPTPRVLIDLLSGAGTPLEGRLRVRQGDKDLGTRPAGQRWELEAGEYVVTVVSGPQQKEGPQTIVVNGRDALQTAHIAVLRPGTVSLTVVSATGEPLEARFSSRRMKLGEGTSWTGELAEGPQTVLVRAEGYQPKRVELVVDGDTPVEREIRLAPARARLDGNRIAISEKLYFDTGSAQIQARSLPLLDEVVAILDQHPEIALLRVAGHTDATGDATANQRLSRARANAVVDYLIREGIDLERLDAVGFGSNKPVMEGTSEEANEANRRVELVVVKRR